MDDDNVLYHESATCQVAVGVLLGEQFGAADCLQFSWGDRDTMEAQWQMLRLCSTWRVSALYGPEKCTLRLYGSGEPILTGPLEPSPFGAMQSALVPVYSGEWTLPDADAVRSFIQGARRNGYFVLLPGVNRQTCTDVRPLFAFLGRGGEHGH